MLCDRLGAKHQVQELVLFGNSDSVRDERNRLCYETLLDRRSWEVYRICTLHLVVSYGVCDGGLYIDLQNVRLRNRSHLIRRRMRKTGIAHPVFRPNIVRWIFLVADILSFIIQSTGGAITTSKDLTVSKNGTESN